MVDVLQSTPIDYCHLDLDDPLNVAIWSHRYCLDPRYLRGVKRRIKQRDLRRELKQSPKAELVHDEKQLVDVIERNPQRQSDQDAVLEADRKLDQQASLARPWVRDPGIAESSEGQVITSDKNMVSSIKRANDNFKAKLDRFVPASSQGAQDMTNNLLRRMQRDGRMRRDDRSRLISRANPPPYRASDAPQPAPVNPSKNTQQIYRTREADYL
jgi:hypothetical protein